MKNTESASIHTTNNFDSIRLNNGLVIMDSNHFKIAKLYDLDLILNSIEEKMAEMRNIGILNTGRIELPCGFYMTDSFYSVAGITTHVYKTGTNITCRSSTFHLMLYSVGYLDANGSKDITIKEYGRRMFELKSKGMTNVKYDEIDEYMKDREVDWEQCFDESSPDQLYKLFRGMQENFMWADIDAMIYVHSIFGQAYTNAVKRVSEYIDSQLAIVKIPESYIVYEEFRKILKKQYFNGFNIRYDLFVCYVQDYLKPNKLVEE